MEFLKRAKVFRLKCEHHDKYLIADQDENRVKQSSESETTKSCWAFEVVEGKPNLIRIRSSHCWKYLATTDESFLTGLTGKKVALRLRLDSTVEWEPIKEGSYIKFKSHLGTFLRANRGPYPWRNTVTHDPPDHRWTGKEDMLLWIVDIVELQTNLDSQPIMDINHTEDDDDDDDDDEEEDNDDVPSSSYATNQESMSRHSSPESSEDFGYDDEQSESSESFGKLKIMLAALGDDSNHSERGERHKD